LENGEKTLESDDVMDGENADFHGDNATEYEEFHTDSEFTEGISEREEHSTDHTVQNKGQETESDDLGSNTEKNAAMDAAIMQMPQNKLEEITFHYTSVFVLLYQ
jgi:hypothetical protein